MADDDPDKPKKHTLDSLFRYYCNYHAYALDLENENQETILLSQIDYWLDQAKLIKTVFTLTETGLIYMKFKKYRLDFEEFIEFLQQLCRNKAITFEQVKEMLLEVGMPGGGEIVQIK